jgi:hypothetical protein
MQLRYDRRRTDGNDPAEHVRAHYESTIDVTGLAWTTGRYGDDNDTITMLMLRCEINLFRLTLTTTTTQ